MRSLRDRIVTAGFTEGDFTFHSGEPANNKLELDGHDIREKDPELFEDIIGVMRPSVAKKKPNALTYVANGARAYTYRLGLELELPVIDTFVVTEDRAPTKRQKVVGDLMNLLRATRATEIVVIEDATSKLGSAIEVMELPLIAGKVVGMDAVWRRGTVATELALPRGVQADWVIPDQPMPNIMTEAELSYWRAIKEEGEQTS